MIKNITLVMASIMIFILSLEGIVRMLQFDDTIAVQRSVLTKHVNKDILKGCHIVCFQPDTQFRHKTKEYDYMVNINSKGLREREIPYKKERGELRILIIGPSWTYGWGVDFEDSVPYRLEKMLRAYYRTDMITVINAGQPAQLIFGNFIFYMIEGHKYAPDIVIHMQAHDFCSQAISDLNRMSKFIGIFTIDGYFQNLYKKSSRIPILNKSELFIFIMERMRRNDRIRYFIGKMLQRSDKKEGVINPLSLEDFFATDEIDKDFIPPLKDIHNLKDYIDKLDAEIIYNTIYGLNPGSRDTHRLKDEADDPYTIYIFNSVAKLIKEFQNILEKKQIKTIFYNVNGHAMFTGESARLDERVAYYAATALDKNKVYYISFDDYLFNVLKHKYGDSFVKELFYSRDQHPNKKGYMLLTKILFDKLIETDIFSRLPGR